MTGIIFVDEPHFLNTLPKLSYSTFVKIKMAIVEARKLKLKEYIADRQDGMTDGMLKYFDKTNGTIFYYLGETYLKTTYEHDQKRQYFIFFGWQLGRDDSRRPTQGPAGLISPASSHANCMYIILCIGLLPLCRSPDRNILS